MSWQGSVAKEWIETSECSLKDEKRILTVVLNKIKIGVDEISKLPIMRASLVSSQAEKARLRS
jgi:hypothetical protein